MEDLDLLTEVARMYYEKNLTQSEIAREIHTSRPTVSRLLQEAKDRRVVEIVIHYPWDRAAMVEQQLQQRFDLKDVRVLDSRGRKGGEALRGVALLAARYLETILRDSAILGMSWGQTVYQTVQQFQADSHAGLKIVQLFGAAMPNSKIDGPELVRQFAAKCNAEYHSIHAPLYVDRPELREVLLNDQHIRETLQLATQADIIITGIGSLESPYAPSQTWLGYLNRSMLTSLRKKGAAGHICAHHYDIDGHILDIDLHKGIVGAPLSVLHNTPQVIGVASGEAKARAILGALNGKHINVLITDDTTAVKVLAMANPGAPVTEKEREER